MPRVFQDRNFIQSAAGSLLIIQARLSDMANYTCVATNQALERQSQPALLTVYGKIMKIFFSLNKSQMCATVLENLTTLQNFKPLQLLPFTFW